MMSRLYPTTRRLFGQVFRALHALDLGAVLSPMTFALTAIYLSRLILQDRWQNSTAWRTGCLPEGTMRSIGSCGRRASPAGW